MFLSPISPLSFIRRNVHDPRALATILEKAEVKLARDRHPDPYIRASLNPYLFLTPRLTDAPKRHPLETAPSFPGGSKWCVCSLMRVFLTLTFVGSEHTGNAIYRYVLVH